MKSNIAVIGLGYVGLPLASLCAKKGYPVTGFESNESIVSILKNDSCHIKDEHLERLLREARASGNLSVTSDKNDLSACTIYLICVPTPIDKDNNPDLAPLLSALDVIGPYLNNNDLIVVESTVFPGTCEEVVIPYIEKHTDKRVGVDIELAHCPERVNPGDAFWTSENIPRVVGATTQQGVDRAADFYASILNGIVIDVREVKEKLRPKVLSSENEAGYEIKQVPIGSVTKMHSIRDAEAVKAMENTVRDVNIAFVNELAKISDALNLDVVDIIDGMSTKPFGKGPFYPGAGVGGHCIAVDPEWLKDASIRAGFMPEIIQLSRNTNNGMPLYTVNLLQDALNIKGYPVNGSRIAVLGISYKKNVDDPRESPFYDIKSLLEDKGAEVISYDPWIPDKSDVDSLEGALCNAKAAIIVTDHNEFIHGLASLALDSIEVIIDGRNCLDAESIQKKGVLYRGIGRR